MTKVSLFAHIAYFIIFPIIFPLRRPWGCSSSRIHLLPLKITCHDEELNKYENEHIVGRVWSHYAHNVGHIILISLSYVGANIVFHLSHAVNLCKAR